MNIKIKLSNFNQELSVLELINRHFFKSLIGIVMSLSLPLMFMIVYFIIGTYKNDPSMFGSSLATYYSFAILPISFISLPLLIVEFKSSIILRKIAVSKITSLSFSFILFTYYFIVNIVIFIFTTLLYAIFLNKNAPTYFSYYNWGELIYAIINVMVLSSTIGFFMGVILKRSAMTQALGMAILFLTQILSGQLMPMSIIATVPPLKYICLLSPMSYPMGLMNNILLQFPKSILEAIPFPLPPDFDFDTIMLGNSIFNLNTFNIIDISISTKKIKVLALYDDWNKILNLVLPPVLSIVFMIYNIKKFNWSSR